MMKIGIYGDDAQWGLAHGSPHGVAEACEHSWHRSHRSTLYFANGSTADTDDDNVSDALAGTQGGRLL